MEMWTKEKLYKLKRESWKDQNAQKVQLNSGVSRSIEIFSFERECSSEIFQKLTPFSLKPECVRQIGPFYIFISKSISATHEPNPSKLG